MPPALTVPVPPENTAELALAADAVVAVRVVRDGASTVDRQTTPARVRREREVRAGAPGAGLLIMGLLDVGRCPQGYEEEGRNSLKVAHDYSGLVPPMAATPLARNARCIAATSRDVMLRDGYAQ
ncbi:hypothetical protein NUM3379_09850 [Kineococcus sp. NUM-3379]